VLFDKCFDLIFEEGIFIYGVHHTMSEEDVKTVMRVPWVSVGSDGSALNVNFPGKPHPRSFGTNVRVLGKYTREEKVLALEEAIRKIDRETRTRFKETFDQVNEYFQSFFPQLFGGGSAHLEMTDNDLLETGVGVMAVAEAFNFAQKSGVDPARVREALLGGFAYSRILENHGQRMLDRNFKPGFKAWMHQKDLRIVMEEAHRLGLMLPSAAATAQMFNAMVGSGMGENDSIAALKLLEKMSSPE